MFQGGEKHQRRMSLRVPGQSNCVHILWYQTVVPAPPERTEYIGDEHSSNDVSGTRHIRK